MMKIHLTLKNKKSNSQIELHFYPIILQLLLEMLLYLLNHRLILPKIIKVVIINILVNIVFINYLDMESISNREYNLNSLLISHSLRDDFLV